MALAAPESDPPANLTLWRISNHADLLGGGGMLASARWHTAGRPVVYLAESPSGALLEVLVHLEVDEAHRPTTYQLLKITAEASLSAEQIDPASLPATWTADEAATQPLGDAWLRGGSTALLRVPSALVPETANWLLNPRHPHAPQLRISAVYRTPFDPRLL